MKRLSLIAFLLISLSAFAQDHSLPEPKDWGTETFPFPIEFAPNIPFKGQEEVRFTPGWVDTTSVQNWSYCFVWWVEKDSKLDAKSLKKYLEEYYGGLVGRNIENRNIPKAKVVPTVASVATTPSAGASFTATVNMLNYHRQKPMKLNIDVYEKSCDANGKKAFFFAVSPRPKTDTIWKDFKNIWTGFTCGN